MDSKLLFLGFMAMHVNHCQTSEHTSVWCCSVTANAKLEKQNITNRGDNVEKLPEFFLVIKE